MAEPSVMDSVSSGDNLDTPDTGAADDPDGDSDSEADEDEIEMVQTDISTTQVDPDGFFDGVDKEATSGDDMGDSVFDGVDDSDESSGSSESGAETRSTGLAADINRGVARAGVIGLEDTWETPSGQEKTKDELRQEFEETFEAFRLGHYASICAEEYLLTDAEDISPVWGLIGASLICSAVIVYRRPDGDQVVEKAKLKLGSTDMGSIAQKLKRDDDDEEESE